MKRIYRLILPVFIWSAIYLFLLNNFSLSSFISIIWAPQGLVHLWFLYMLFGLYLMSPFLILIFNIGRYDLVKYFLILWFIFSSIGIYTNAIIGGALGQWYGLFPTYISGFLGYYVLGAYLMQRSVLPIYISIIIFLFGVVLSYLLVFYDNYNSQSFNDRYLNFLAPNVVIMAVGFFNILRNIRWDVFLNPNLLKFIGSLVIGIYLIHEKILKLFREYFGLVGKGDNPLIFIPLMAISVFILSLFVSYILRIIQRKYQVFF